jgi:hypothetical protein
MSGREECGGGPRRAPTADAGGTYYMAVRAVQAWVWSRGRQTDVLQRQLTGTEKRRNVRRWDVTLRSPDDEKRGRGPAGMTAGKATVE